MIRSPILTSGSYIFLAVVTDNHKAHQGKVLGIEESLRFTRTSARSFEDPLILQIEKSQLSWFRDLNSILAHRAERRPRANPG